MSIAPELLRRIVEGALLASGQPLSEDKLLSLIDEGERPEKPELKQALEEIAESCHERGFELRQVASGWRFQVPEDLAPWVNKLWEEKPQKYSRATLETLAIIAYRQPITRGDIEEIRGVAVSSHIVKSLSERGWIKVVGQRDVPGKPSLYATTREFLDYFNLKSLEDLPTLAEIRDIESLNAALDLGDAMTPAADVSEGEADGDVAAEMDDAINTEDEDASEVEMADVTAEQDVSMGEANAEDSYAEADDALDDAAQDDSIETEEEYAQEVEEGVAVVATPDTDSGQGYADREPEGEPEPEKDVKQELGSEEQANENLDGQEMNTPENQIT
ncbi:SMC-Scp complex subunit ScpB [Microbulbifer sp. SA54]|uniref:SMC-Scp complex subunit ScpB n=1 Tax=Microbulbifer sp. SA54 TaxID=3401577 RepID=UPI003AAF94CF